MKKLTFISLLLGLLLPLGVEASQPAKIWSYWDKSNEKNRHAIDHSAWDRLLKRYVVTNHPSGINRFRYANVSREDARELDRYIDSLASLDPRDYCKRVQKAYWLNLYNALTVQLVLHNYPIDSITEIRGAWDKRLVKVARKKLSLNDIENRILRPIWEDHRIHFALNSASLGSPQILPEAFTYANTRKLLKQAGKDFINHPRGVLLEAGELHASSIFDWYQQDFARDEKMLTKIFAHYANDRLALYLLGYQGGITYAHDWRLNAP